jgi:hypothetical protein
MTHIAASKSIHYAAVMALWQTVFDEGQRSDFADLRRKIE